MPRAKPAAKERKEHREFLLFAGHLRAKVKRINGRLPEAAIRRICRRLDDHMKPVFPLQAHLERDWNERLKKWNDTYPEDRLTRWSQAIERDCRFRPGVLKTLNHAEQVYHRLGKAKSVKSKPSATDGRVDPRKLAQALAEEQERRELEKGRLRLEKEREERERRLKRWDIFGHNPERLDAFFRELRKKPY